MPRKQRFKPSRKPKLAEGTTPLSPIAPQVLAPIVPTPPAPPPEPHIRPVRGKDAIIDD